MCGIAGFCGPGDRTDIERMTRAIAHRGPDCEGFHHDEGAAVFLGHRRLSIIDIEGGAQPMWNRAHTVAVIFNGEIYNHLELRRELETHGHRFASDHSDTEVLVHGWEHWGSELPARLNGMFGFAIWDVEKKQIFLARDRFGEKPLYWGRKNGLFLFASELSSFAQHRQFDIRADRLALKKYFAHGFIPSPNAFYQNTHKLPAGNWLRFEVSGGAIKQNCYWQLQIEPDEAPPSLADASDEVGALLRQSVDRRMMSDVPLGVFLSGGIDSSAVAGYMRELHPKSEINSFSIGFKEKSFDESEHARAMASLLKCNHHESILESSASGAIMEDVLGRLDEPLGDPSLLPTYLLCRFARERVTVALSGDGGDELFAGYDPFAALAIARFYKAIIPGKLHSGMRRLADLLPKSEKNMSFDFKLRRALAGLDHKAELWNPAWLAPLERGDIEELFEEPVSLEELYSEVLTAWRGSTAPTLVDKTCEFYSRFYLPDNILTKVDRAAMLNGLETRSVYLDNDLVDFVRRLPARYKYHRGSRKIVLKEAVRNLLPETILSRPKKGFGIPLAAWLKDMEIGTSGAAELGMNEDFIVRRTREHRGGKQDQRLFLWCWSVLDRHGGAGAPTS